MTIIGYGLGGSNGKGIKGASMPIKTFCNHMKRQPHILFVGINENYTSQICSHCHKKLFPFMQWKLIEIPGKVSEWKLTEVHGLRRCKSNECRQALYGRDENSARDIYDILVAGATGKPRPAHLCKPLKTPNGESSLHVKIVDLITPSVTCADSCRNVLQPIFIKT